MLPGLIALPGLMGAGGGGREISFLSTANDTANLSTYTFASYGLGDAAGNRYVALCVMVTSGHVTGVTIGGVTAIELVESFSAGGGSYVGWWIAAVPTGTTGNVVVSTSDSPGGCSIAGYRITGIAGVTPVDTAWVYGSSGVHNVSVFAAAGDIVLAGAITISVATSWVGVTEDYDFTQESSVLFTGGHAIPDVTGSPRTVTATGSILASAAVTLR